MDTEDKWRILVNECDENNSRLIFLSSKHKSLIDITIQSPSVQNVVNTVVASNWDDSQVIDYLNSESRKVMKEVF